MIKKRGAGKPHPARHIKNASKYNNLTIKEALELINPVFRMVYENPEEIQNYSQPGSYFHGMNKKQILDKITAEAIKEGLDPKLREDFMMASALWDPGWEKYKRRDSVELVALDGTRVSIKKMTKNGRRKVPDTHNLKKNMIINVRKDVKDEHKNIDIILNTAMSAFTENPENLAVVGSSSEGKTYLVTKALRRFPKQYVMMYRKVSPKVFTRERGQLAVRVIDGNVERYETEITNEFTGETQKVFEYIDFLTEKAEAKKGKKNSGENLGEEPLENEGSVDPREARRALSDLKDNLFTLIDFRNKILVFLDKPEIELWNELLSTLSHDQMYIVTGFVEGEGRKYVRKVVFCGWPAVIFCTSKDEDFNWRDLETRFQIIEPVMSTRKYTDAANYAVAQEFAIGEPDDLDNQDTKRLDDLIRWVIQEKPRVVTPFPTEKLARAVTGGEVKTGDLMRKIPRLLTHSKIAAIWNASERVILDDGKRLYIVLAYRDILSLVFLFDDLELGASMAGLGVSVYELLTRVLVSLFGDHDEDGRDVTQKRVEQAFLDYTAEAQKKHKTIHMGTTKRSFRNYMKDLEGRGYIKRIQDENDKRSLMVIPIWGEIPHSFSLFERLKKLGKPMEIADIPNMGYLWNHNFEAFFGSQKIGKASLGDNEIETENYPENLEFIELVLRRSGYLGMFPSNAFPNFNNIDQREIKTDKTASDNDQKDANALKTGVPFGFPNFSDSDLQQHNGEDREHKSQTEPSKSEVQNETSITEDQGNEIVQSLLKENFYIDPRDTGVSHFTPNLFKISVKKPKDDAELAILMAKMEEEGFKLENQGTLGYLIFSIALKKE